jgi:hypothetical protein
MLVKIKKTDDVLWKKHLEREGVSPPLGEPFEARVGGTPVEFVPMRAGAPGWRAEGPGRPAWLAIPKGTEVSLEFEPVRGGRCRTGGSFAAPGVERVPGAPALPAGRMPEVVQRVLAGHRGSGRGVFIGIDVGGRPDKGFDLCPTWWDGGVPARLEFHRLPHRLALPPTDELRPVVAAGRVDELAERTYRSAGAIAADLWRALERFGPTGVLIDASSAFSRNAVGHGRYTEKFALKGVSFQSTPSVACGRPHAGEWGWLVYGMIAFAACVYRGEVSLERWYRGLAEGFDRACRADELIVREVFPTGTVETLRHRGRASEVVNLLAGLHGTPAVDVVRLYLENGVWGNKLRVDLSDQADSLIAALGALPYVRGDFAERVLEPGHGTAKWRPAVPDAREIEGAVVVPE